MLLQTRSLFGWKNPDFPEDIAFYGERDKCGFASVGHERMYWVLDRSFLSAVEPHPDLAEREVSDKDYPIFQPYIQGGSLDS